VGIFKNCILDSDIVYFHHMETKKLNGFEYFLLVFKKYAQFGGRSTRSELWYFILFSNLLILTFFLVVYFLRIHIGVFIWFVLLYGLATIIPFIALFVRRFHDIELGKNVAVPYIIWFTITVTLFVIGINMINNDSDVLYGLLAWGMFVFSIVLFFVGLSPFPIVFLAFFQNSQPGENKYGPNPKGIGNGNTVPSPEMPTQPEDQTPQNPTI
jgi:uncharacterized membrane protein YhaH (DUF805 family)